MELYVDTVELPDGSVHEDFHRIVLPEFAVIVAVTTDGRFVMIREHKHGLDCIVLKTAPDWQTAEKAAGGPAAALWSARLRR